MLLQTNGSPLSWERKMSWTKHLLWKDEGGVVMSVQRLCIRKRTDKSCTMNLPPRVGERAFLYHATHLRASVPTTTREVFNHQDWLKSVYNISKNRKKIGSLETPSPSLPKHTFALWEMSFPPWSLGKVACFCVTGRNTNTSWVFVMTGGGGRICYLPHMLVPWFKFLSPLRLSCGSLPVFVHIFRAGLIILYCLFM